MIHRSWKNIVNYMRSVRNNFRVVSFNILSDSALFNNSGLYKNCHPLHLTWNYRLPRILDEILIHQPDVICLQEVTGYHYDQCLKPLFDKLNFGSVYKQKNDPKADGCAIFFNNDTFELRGSYGIDIVPLLPMNWRTQTALCAVLTFKYTPEECFDISYNKQQPNPNNCKNNPISFAIVSTHLKYSPKDDYYRCIQTEYLLNEIKRLKNNGSMEDIPIILCGDFNSKTNSIPIKLIINQLSPQSHIEGSYEKEVNVDNTSGTFSQSSNPSISTSSGGSSRVVYNSPVNNQTKETASSLQMFDFNFKSVYPLYECTQMDNSSKRFTTCVNCKNADIVDYMFYHNPNAILQNTQSSHRTNEQLLIEPCGFLKIPISLDSNNVTLPNSFHGSDHIPLVADFHFVLSDKYPTTATNI